MSYYFSVIDSYVLIPKDDVVKAVEILHSAGYGDGTEDIDDILDDEGYSIERDKDGNIVGVYTNYNIRDDSSDTLWSKLAPVIGNGSHIDFEGEDGYKWRYSFHDGDYDKYDGTVVFENDVDKLRRMLAHAENIVAERGADSKQK